MTSGRQPLQYVFVYDLDDTLFRSSIIGGAETNNGQWQMHFEPMPHHSKLQNSFVRIDNANKKAIALGLPKPIHIALATLGSYEKHTAAETLNRLYVTPEMTLSFSDVMAYYNRNSLDKHIKYKYFSGNNSSIGYYTDEHHKEHLVVMSSFVGMPPKEVFHLDKRKGLLLHLEFNRWKETIAPHLTRNSVILIDNSLDNCKGAGSYLFPSIHLAHRDTDTECVHEKPADVFSDNLQDYNSVLGMIEKYLADVELEQSQAQEPAPAQSPEKVVSDHRAHALFAAHEDLDAPVVEPRGNKRPRNQKDGAEPNPESSQTVAAKALLSLREGGRP